MAIPRQVAALTLVVDDYDRAIEWFTRALNFDLLQDIDLGKGKRWVLVAPSSHGAALLLARAASHKQALAIGNQSGGRVFLFLHTDDFDRDRARMLAEGVSFLESPRDEAYGKVAVFEDLYGNRWDLIEPV